VAVTVERKTIRRGAADLVERRFKAFIDPILNTTFGSDSARKKAITGGVPLATAASRREFEAFLSDLSKTGRRTSG
jgi:hypothetical protein